MTITRQHLRYAAVGLIGAILLIAGVLYVSRDDSSITSLPQRKLHKVVFGVLPYLDHTYAAVAAEFGWFRDAGIGIELKEVGVEHIVPWLRNGTVDVCSTPPGILMAAWDGAPNLRSFVFGNLFTGYAIMAQPDQRYRTYQQFRADGHAPPVAAQRAVAQLKGRRLAYPPEDAIRPFIDLTLSRADLRLEDLETVVMDDPLTVNAMRQRTVDFQTGGAPSRVTLQGEGYVPIFTSLDLLEFAKPSAESRELAGILQNGWATTKSFYEEQHEVVLRLACVSYRIMEALQDPAGRAREIHLRYLAKLTGVKNYTATQVEALYNDLNRFRTFEQQADWFENPASTQYYKYVNGAILKSWTDRKGYFQKQAPTVEDVILADDTFRELKTLRKRTETLRAAVVRAENANPGALTAAQGASLDRASRQFQEWNVIDAERTLAALVKELRLRVED